MATENSSGKPTFKLDELVTTHFNEKRIRFENIERIKCALSKHEALIQPCLVSMENEEQKKEFIGCLIEIMGDKDEQSNLEWFISTFATMYLNRKSDLYKNFYDFIQQFEKILSEQHAIEVDLKQMAELLYQTKGVSVSELTNFLERMNDLKDIEDFQRVCQEVQNFLSPLIQTPNFKLNPGIFSVLTPVFIDDSFDKAREYRQYFLNIAQLESILVEERTQIIEASIHALQEGKALRVVFMKAQSETSAYLASASKDSTLPENIETTIKTLKANLNITENAKKDKNGLKGEKTPSKKTIKCEEEPTLAQQRRGAYVPRSKT